MKKTWSNTCERTQSKEEEQAEDSSYPKGLDILLKETTFQTPRTSKNPQIAPQDYDVRQSERVLEFQNEIFGYNKKVDVIS